jgi:glycosyltransferase involved in cell wall biosynthesis
MRVLALVERADHVCCRYRVEAFAWAMHERGMTLETAALGHGVLARLTQIRRCRAADVVILQRKLLPLWQLALLRRAAARLIYDVDDLLLARDSYHPKGPDSWPRMARFWTTVYAADAVIAGNGYLADRVAAYVGAGRVGVVPTCVEPRRYRLARHVATADRVRLVWIGQPSTLPSLERASAQLAAVGRRLPGAALRIVSDQCPTLPGLPVEARRWAAETEAADLAETDIGVNWLPDDAWSRGKCGLRVLQYMAAGLPVVANPVGMNRELVVDGQTGFLASTPEEWAEAAARLAADPALRRRMGLAGRRLVERRFSVDVWGPRFAELIERVSQDRFREGTSAFAREGQPRLGDHGNHSALPAPRQVHLTESHCL